VRWALSGVGISFPFVVGKVGCTYIGTIGAFVSFGIAWLTAAWDLMPRSTATQSMQVPRQPAVGGSSTVASSKESCSVSW
jgi:hypothetical protein